MIAGQMNAAIAAGIPCCGQLSAARDSTVALSEIPNQTSGVTHENRTSIPMSAGNGRTRSRRYHSTLATMIASKEQAAGNKARIGWPLSARSPAVGISHAAPPKTLPNHPPICHWKRRGPTTADLLCGEFMAEIWRRGIASGNETRHRERANRLLTAMSCNSRSPVDAMVTRSIFYA